MDSAFMFMGILWWRFIYFFLLLFRSFFFFFGFVHDVRDSLWLDIKSHDVHAMLECGSPCGVDASSQMSQYISHLYLLRVVDAVMLCQ